MSKPTPGPWLVGELCRNQIRINHTDNTPGAITGTIALVSAYQTWMDEAEANARLIAAAPDLLEALNLAAVELAGLSGVDHMDDYELAADPNMQGVKESLEKIRAAIAKAKGE